MRKRSGEPWMKPDAYGRTLTGLTLNLIVREIARSLPFYRDVLGSTVLYADVDFAALECAGVRMQLHADHTYDSMPWQGELAAGLRRGLGAELRILGIDPDAAERRARAAGVKIVRRVGDRGFGWRDVTLEDPDGYTFAVGIPT